MYDDLKGDLSSYICPRPKYILCVYNHCCHMTSFSLPLFSDCANFGFNIIHQIKNCYNTYWEFIQIITYLYKVCGPHLSGVWLCVDLRTDTKKMCV